MRSRASVWPCVFVQIAILLLLTHANPSCNHQPHHLSQLLNEAPLPPIMSEGF